MTFLTFIGEHFIDVLFSLLTAFLLYICKKIWADKEKYKKMINDNKDQILAETMSKQLDEKLKPIINSIDTLKSDFESLREDIQKISKKEQEDVDTFLDSEKTRLINLCQGHLEKGYMTPEESRTLTHLYSNYQSLGGNGEAEKNYNRVATLPVHE